MTKSADTSFGGDRSAVARARVEAEQPPFLRYVARLAMRWKKTILGIIGGSLLIGLIVTLLMTPQYTATTTIEIARESDKVIKLQGIQAGAGDADQEFYETQYGLLRSRSLTERIAMQTKLVDDPAFFELLDFKSDDPSFTPDRSGRLPATGRDERRRIAGKLLRDNVYIAPLHSSRLVDLSFTSPDPVLSMKVANAWYVNFIQATLERRYEATSYTRRFLEGQLQQMRRRIEQSERDLVDYAAANKIINLPDARGGGERPIVVDDLTALNTALAQSTADRILAEARYRASGRGGRGGGETAEALMNPAITTLRARRANLAADYEKLMTQFEPAYPPAKQLSSQIAELDRSIAGEVDRVSGSLARNYRETLGRERGLQRRVDALKSSLLDTRRSNIQYAIYEREAETNRELYEALLQRYKEIGVTGGVGANNVAVVDVAEVPERATSPRPALNMLLALIIGCALGAIAAFLLEQSDEAIIDPAEVERTIGLPLLGSVPKLVGRTPVQALSDRKSDMVDAYLAVQTNLAFSTERGVPASIAVTSTRPAEGKSTTSIALATTLARARKRVVLVDGDMRSPSVHHLIGSDHARGLSNFLAGDDDVAPLLHQVDTFGFAAMTAGPLPPNAAELLSSDRLRLLIDRLLETFDHVVIDSPPVMGLADAPLIASRVDGVIFAVESHGIRSSLVRTALDRLASADARVLGAVLTKFEAKRSGNGYDYGYNYGREQRA